MSFLQAVLLGIVQGLTEFLPISSSGHLVLMKSILGFREDGIAFEIFVHFGTLLAIVTLYKKELWQIIVDITRPISGRARPAEPAQNGGIRLLLFLVIGTVPAGMLGLLLRDFFEKAFSSTTFVYGALIFTGLVLLSSRRSPDATVPLDNFKSLVVGLVQVIAFFPGVSRSGTTISASLLLGISREESARFSFLLAVPLILGVTLIKSFEMLDNPPTSDEISYFVAGSVAAYISGLWAIKWLVGVVEKGRFDRFAYYCFAVGTIGLIIKLIR